MRARLAKLLLDLSENGARTIDRRHYTISDLAARIATVPEAISRTLGEFKADRLLESDRLTIRIHSPEQLAILAQSDLL